MATATTSSTSATAPGLQPRPGASSTGAVAGSSAKATSSTAPSQVEVPPFRADLKFRNTLPELPFDPKFLPFPFPPEHLHAYRQTTLERNYKYRIHMTPPTLPGADLLDQMGAEECARAVVLDERDRQLLRKEGDQQAKQAKHPLTNQEKAWMLKTVYLPTSADLTAPSAASRDEALSKQQLQIGDGARARRVPRGDGDARLGRILSQFEATASGALPPPPSAGVTLKRSYPLLPSRRLAGLKLYHVKFGHAERFASRPEDEAEDVWRSARSLLVTRETLAPGQTRRSEYDPMAMYMTKRLRAASNPDEEDIFADDDESPEAVKTAVGVYDSSKAVYVRDYQVRVVREERSQRLALIFGDDVIEYSPLGVDVLLLSRSFRPSAAGEEAQSEHEVPVLQREWTASERDERARRGAVLAATTSVVTSVSE